MAVSITLPYMQFFDDNGAPLSGGKVYTYEAGTTTPKATYTDNTEVTQNANPVILDSAGRCEIWVSGTTKFVITDSSDVEIDTLDNVPAYSASAGSNSLGSIIGLDAISPATGDYIPFADVSDSNDNKRCTVQQILDLASSAAAGLVPIETQTASSDASLDFTSNIDGTYNVYKLVFSGLVPASDGQVLNLRMGNGGTFDSGASDYEYTGYNMENGNSTVEKIDAAASSEIVLCLNGVGNAAGESISGEIYIYAPANTGLFTAIKASTTSTSSSPKMQSSDLSGQRLEAAAHDRIQLLFATGNITSGTATLYGVAGA